MAEVEFREDRIGYPLMIKIISCLVDEIEESGLPPVCFAGLLPGAEVSWDYVDMKCKGADGQAWVAVNNAFPTSTFPIPDDGSIRTCSTALAIELQVGILRKAPMISQAGGKPVFPTVEQQLDATRLQMAEMAAMRRAISCCMGANEDIDYTLGAYTPVGPEGGAVGGVWIVTVSQ